MYSDIELLHKEFPHCAIYLCGSCCVPWILHSRDEDYGILTNSDVEWEQIHRFRRLHHANHKDCGVIIHLSPMLEKQYFDPRSHRSLFAYQWSYLKPVFGTPPQPPINIFDASFRKIFITTLQQHTTVDYSSAYRKSLYHIYINLLLFLHENDNFSEKEVARINRFHDQVSTDEDCKELRLLLKKEEEKWI